MKKEAQYPRIEPSELVEQAIYGLEEDLYGAAKDARRVVYKALLDNLCHMLLIDGGPTFGRELLEEGCADMRRWEEQRGCKERGPFLSKAQRDELIETPGGYLRFEFDIAGPLRWEVTNGN